MLRTIAHKYSIAACFMYFTLIVIYMGFLLNGALNLYHDPFDGRWGARKFSNNQNYLRSFTDDKAHYAVLQAKSPDDLKKIRLEEEVLERAEENKRHLYSTKKGIKKDALFLMLWSLALAFSMGVYKKTNKSPV